MEKGRLCHRLLHVHLSVVVAFRLEADRVHQSVREQVHELGVQDGDDAVYDTSGQCEVAI